MADRRTATPTDRPIWSDALLAASLQADPSPSHLAHHNSLDLHLGQPVLPDDKVGGHAVVSVVDQNVPG